MPTPVFLSPWEWKALCIWSTHQKVNSDLLVPWEQKLLPGDKMGDPRLLLILLHSLQKSALLGTPEQMFALWPLFAFEIVIRRVVSPGAYNWEECGKVGTRLIRKRSGIRAPSAPTKTRCQAEGDWKGKRESLVPPLNLPLPRKSPSDTHWRLHQSCGLPSACQQFNLG